jgi:hypothetical protein
MPVGAPVERPVGIFVGALLGEPVCDRVGGLVCELVGDRVGGPVGFLVDEFVCVGGGVMEEQTKQRGLVFLHDSNALLKRSSALLRLSVLCNDRSKPGCAEIT